MLRAWTRRGVLKWRCQQSVDMRLLLPGFHSVTGTLQWACIAPARLRYPLFEKGHHFRCAICDCCNLCLAGDPTPTADVKPPSWLGGQEQSRLASGLYVSDFLHQFGKSLGLKSLSFSDLERVLGAAGSKDAASGDELGAATLHGIYQQLLQVWAPDCGVVDICFLG